MTDAPRDLDPEPDLAALVRELNASADRGGEEAATPDGPAGPPRSPARSRRDLPPRGELALLLGELVQRGGSDLLLVPGAGPAVRIHGELVALGSEPLAAEAVWEAFREHLEPRHHAALESSGAADFTLRRPGGGRFRVNLHRQRGGVAAAVRALPGEIPTLASLGLPAELATVVQANRGLVLVCGATGAGKSSTLAALVGEINRRRPAHVVTIEEPVEFEHRNQRSLVEHVEVGADAPSFATALRAALRQDPDVLLVGEMRDLETISIALTAAETGHLVLATLHTADAVQAVHRIVDVFPAGQQPQVRQQLALSLHAIVCQQLVPRPDGRGRVAAVEMLRSSHAVRNHIRQDKVHNLYNEMVLGQRQGMMTLESSLARLVREGAIAREEAELRAGRPDELRSLLGEALA